MGKASERTNNGHTKTLAALTSALTLYNVFNPVENVSSAGAAPKEAAPQLSLNVSLGYSSSEYRSVYNEVTPSEVAIVAGGNISIQATGHAAQEQGDISIIGAKLSAGRGLSLQAANDVNILAAKGTTNESSTTKADSAAIGVSYVIGSGGSGLSGTLSASRTRGFTNGRGVEYMPTVLTAGASGSSQGRLSVSSGRHTGILGATLSGHEVVMEVGTQGAGDLTVASVQDSSFYEGQEKTTGVSVSIPINGGAASLGLNYSKLKLLADYQSAKEQTAIRAGAGGFDLWVRGDTVLKGAVIASTAEAGMNVLSTRSLLMQDFINQANVSGRSDTLTLQYNKKADSGGGLQGHFGGSGYGTARIDRKTMGHTLAAISPASINILSHDRQYERLYGPGTGRTAPATSHDAALNTARQKLAADQAALAGCTTDACRSSYNQAIAADQTQISSAERLRNRTLSTQYVASVRRDVNGAHMPVDADFVDPGKVTAELKTEVAVMVAFSKAGYQAAGTFSEKQLQKAREKLEDANRTTADPALQAQLRAEAAELQRLWGDSGPGRAALHALVGGSALGVAGAAASAGNVLAADYIDQAVRAAMNAAGVDPAQHPTLLTALKMTGSTVLGAAVGGANGAAATFNADANNRQLHPEVQKFVVDKGRVQRYAQLRGISLAAAEDELFKAAGVLNDQGWDKLYGSSVTEQARQFLLNESVNLRLSDGSGYFTPSEQDFRDASRFAKEALAGNGEWLYQSHLAVSDEFRGFQSNKAQLETVWNHFKGVFQSAADVPDNLKGLWTAVKAAYEDPNRAMATVKVALEQLGPEAEAWMAQQNAMMKLYGMYGDLDSANAIKMQVLLATTDPAGKLLKSTKVAGAIGNSLEFAADVMKLESRIGTKIPLPELSLLARNDGMLAESLAKQASKEFGLEFKVLQNNSKHGVDLYGYDPVKNQYVVVEVKSSTVGSFGAPPSIGPSEFLRSRAALAAAGEKAWDPKNTPLGMRDAGQDIVKNFDNRPPSVVGYKFEVTLPKPNESGIAPVLNIKKWVSN